MAECLVEDFASDLEFQILSFENYSSGNFALFDTKMQRAYKIYQTMNNTNYTSLDEDRNMFHFIPVILCAIGVIENGISLAAIAHVRSQGDTMYHILGNLSFSDMLLSATGAAFFALHLQGTGDLSETTVCLTNLLRLIMITSIYTGAFSTVCLVIYTALKVLKPLKNLNLLYSPRIWVLLVAIWITSVLLGFGTYIKSVANSKVLTYECICVTYVFDATNLYIEIGITTGIVGISLIIVSGCYARVLCIAYAARKRSDLLCSNEGFNHTHDRGCSRQAVVALRSSDSNSDLHEHHLTNAKDAPKKKRDKRKGPMERRLKVAVTAFLLYGVLLIFWLPYVVVNVITSAEDLTSGESAWYSYIVTNLFIGNAIIDPLIYGLRLRRVRAGFAAMFRRVRGACGSKFKVEYTSSRSTMTASHTTTMNHNSVVTYYSSSSPQTRRNFTK